MCALRRIKNEAKLFVCLFISQTPRIIFMFKYWGRWKNLRRKGTIELTCKTNKIIFLVSWRFVLHSLCQRCIKFKTTLHHTFFWHYRHQNIFPWILHTWLIPKHNSVDPQKTNKHDVQAKHFQPFELFFFIRLFIPEKCFRMKFGEIPKRKNAAHDSTQLWCGREKGNSFEPFFVFALSFVRHTSGSR